MSMDPKRVQELLKHIKRAEVILFYAVLLNLKKNSLKQALLSGNYRIKLIKLI